MEKQFVGVRRNQNDQNDNEEAKTKTTLKRTRDRKGRLGPETADSVRAFTVGAYICKVLATGYCHATYAGHSLYERKCKTTQQFT